MSRDLENYIEIGNKYAFVHKRNIKKWLKEFRNDKFAKMDFYYWQKWKQQERKYLDIILEGSQCKQMIINH